jgi:hypothetical protein
MKKIILTYLFLGLYAPLIHSQKNDWRADKKNEISAHLKTMWNNEFFSYGLGYERNIYKFQKAKYNSFLSWQTEVYMRIGFDRPIDISSSSNQLQTFIKYNIGYKKILSIGLGTILVGEKFFINPTLTASYKYDFRKKNITLGLNYQISRSTRRPPFNLPLSMIPLGATVRPYNIFELWCGGVSIGKYF